MEQIPLTRSLLLYTRPEWRNSLWLSRTVSKEVCAASLMGTTFPDFLVHRGSIDSPPYVLSLTLLVCEHAVNERMSFFPDHHAVVFPLQCNTHDKPSDSDAAMKRLSSVMVISCPSLREGKNVLKGELNEGER